MSMRKLNLVLLLSLILGKEAFSQVQWKVFSGMDFTPVKTNLSLPYSWGYDLNNDYWESWGSIEKMTLNTGLIGFSASFKAKKVLFDIGVSGGNYYRERIVRTSTSRYNHINGQSQTTGDTLYQSSNYFLPCGKVSVGYSLSPKFSAMLFVGNFDNLSIMSGISLDKRLGKHFGISVSGYKPMQKFNRLEKVEKSFGLGLRLSYYFRQKEKSKKTNSTPTVL